MKIQNRALFFITLFALSVSLTLAASAQDSEKKVKMKGMPPAVQATVKQQSEGATLRGLAKEVEGGKTFYEAELMVNDHRKDVLMDTDGKVVSIEEEVPLASVPAIIKAEIEKQAGKRKIQFVESITKDGAIVYYEAHVKSGIKSKEIKVGMDGKLMK
ncbi:MAG: hypothetical protein ABIU20_05375 [Blastocatellia bacterium]